MDLALAPGETGKLPAGFHFGFRLETPEAVRALHEQLVAEGDTLRTPLTDDGHMVWFRCADPDGHQIEIYWEA